MSVPIAPRLPALLLPLPRLLLLLLLLSCLAGCGVITEDDFPGCEPTGSIKTYRGPTCQRICKSEYASCTNGKRADPDQNCACTGQVIRFEPPMVPDPIVSSCACRYERESGSVSLHQVACRDWLPYVVTGETRTGIGRPIGSGQDSTCTNLCRAGGGSELRGTFLFKTIGPGTCQANAVTFPGTILGDWTSGGQTVASGAHSVQGETAGRQPMQGRDAARLFPRWSAAEREQAMPAAPPAEPAGPLGMVAATRFKMHDQGIDCSAECAADGEACSDFKIDSGNADAIANLVALLPPPNTAKRLALNDMRSLFANVTSTCPHEWIDIASSGRVRSIGAQCEQRLYLSFPGVDGFASSIVVPPVVEGQLTTSETRRRIEFRDERQMPTLRLLPASLQRLYGGKIRVAESGADGLVIETQNRCLAVRLE